MLFHDLILPLAIGLLILQLALGLVSLAADRSAGRRPAATLKTRKPSRDEPQPDPGVILPSPVQRLMLATHVVFAITVAAGLLSLASGRPAPKFIEYMVVYTGGGVIYQRGLLPKGWVQRLLTEPPRATRLMLYGCGWCFAAILGYIFQSGAVPR